MFEDILREVSDRVKCLVTKVETLRRDGGGHSDAGALVDPITYLRVRVVYTMDLKHQYLVSKT